MQSFSAFHRRVLLRVRSFPHLLLDLVRLPAKQFCPVRQQLAKQLHETDSAKLEFNARKFKLLHAKEIAQLGLEIDGDSGCWNSGPMMLGMLHSVVYRQSI